MSESAPVTPPTVLVVEDEPFLRDTIQQELEQHAVQVLCASNGEEALRLLDQHDPVLILLDLLMPKVDGIGVLSILRQAGRQTPVVILSNLSDELDRQRCADLGARGFLVKSDMDDDDLWPKISQFLPG